MNDHHSLFFQKLDDHQQVSHMSMIPLYVDEHQDLQAVRQRKDSSIQAESDYNSNIDDVGSRNAIKKNSKDIDFHLDISKKLQTSTYFAEMSKGQSPQLIALPDNQQGRDSEVKDNHNFLDVDAHSICQGSMYSISKKEKKVPRRLMRAINLLVNVKSFYNQLTKNTRIFQKLTQEQYLLIGDSASFYSSNLMQSKNGIKKNWHAFKIVSSVISEMIRLLQNIPLIEPHKKLKTIWDSLQAILIILIIFFFSMVIVFGIDPQNYHSFLQVTLILFSVDMAFQFNTGIIYKGSVVYSRIEIAKQYVKGNFIMDTLSILPLIQVNSQIQLDYYIQNRSFPQILLQCCIIFKVFYLKNIIDRLEQRFGYYKNLENLIDLLKLLFTIGSICHFFSLLWYGLGDFEANIQKNKDSWLNYVGIQDSDIYTKYIYSFYYIATTMITVGYGDITPQNPVEVTFSVITMFLTGVVYAYSLNCIGNILENINEVNKDYRRDMRTIHQLMAEQNVKVSLRVKVSNYVEYICKVFFIFISNQIYLQNKVGGNYFLIQSKKLQLIQYYQNQKILFLFIKQRQMILSLILKQIYQQTKQQESSNQQKIKQDEIVSKLSEKLRNELMNEIKGKFISDIPLFKDIITQSTQNKIIQKMQECHYSPGEVIFSQHDSDDCAIYYILKGQVKISLEDSVHRTVRLIERRGCFGEISFITGDQRIGTATATDFCRIYKIKRLDFQEIIRDNNQDLENFQMLYEAVCLKGNLKFAKLYCYSCKKGDHLAERCPKTHLILSKQILIQKYNKTEPIILRNFQKRRKTKQNSKTINHTIQDALYNIHSHPEYAEVIELLEELAHLNDSYLELYYGDEDVSNYDTVSNQINFKAQQEKQQSVNDRAPSSHHSVLDKNDLTPSQSSEDDYDDEDRDGDDDDDYTSSMSSKETTTIDQNSEFSSKKKKKNGSKKGTNRSKEKKRQQHNFQNENNENLIEELSEESIQDTQTNTITNATKFSSKMIKITQQLEKVSDTASIQDYGNDEKSHYLLDDKSHYMDDLSRKFHKDQDDDISVRCPQDTQSRSSQVKKQNYSSTNLISSFINLSPVKRKSFHQEVLEKQNQQFNDSEGFQAYKSVINSSINPNIFGLQHSHTAFSNFINQSIAGFNDINISTNNLDENGAIRDKKSNSLSASKYKLDESSSKQNTPHYRKSVSFDPNYFTELQRNYMKKQGNSNLNKNSSRSIEDSGGAKRYKPLQVQISQSSYQRIPSAIKNSQLQLQFIHSNSNNLSVQPTQSLQRMSTRNFKRQSTKTNNTRPSRLSFNSSTGGNFHPQKGILKRAQDGRQQLQPQDLRIIQMNEDKLKEIYENQKQLYLNNETMNPAIYQGSKEENGENQIPIDVIKNYLYYYPQFNVQNVLLSYQQLMEKSKIVQKRPTIVGKTGKRIKRVLNQKKIKHLIQSNNLNSVPITQLNIAENTQQLPNLEKIQKVNSFYNTNINTHLLQSDKFANNSDLNNINNNYVFSNATDQIKVSETHGHKNDYENY